MFKCNITHTNKYSEMGQPNPMKWRLMFKEEDGSLSSQSGLIVCKDFFNDVVAWKQTKTAFSIYNFNNQVKFNDEGMYIVLSNIADKVKFTKNILKGINPQLQEDLGVSIKVYQQGRGRVVVLLPHEVWKSTYHISLVSMLIRLSNYAATYTCWEDFYAPDAPMNTIEHAFSTQAKEFTLKHRLSLPEEVAGCWYFSRFGYTSKSKYDIESNIVHNNGATDWARAYNDLKEEE